MKYKEISVYRINSEKKKIILLCIFAFFIRLFILSLVYLLEDTLGQFLFSDDRMYLNYAITYSNISERIIDFEKLKQAEMMFGGFSSSGLYFKLNAILYYIFRSSIALRVANIVVSVCTIPVLFLIAKELFNKKVGLLAVKLYAYMPYYAIFSVFIFKDLWIMLLVILLIYQLIKLYKYNRFNVILFIILLMIVENLRKGVGLFLIGTMLFILLFNSNKVKGEVKKILIFLSKVILIVTFGLFFIKVSGSILSERINSYMSYGRDSQSGGLSIVRIDNLFEIYKLPFTYIFSLIMPLSFNLKINGWIDIISILNYIFIPIPIAMIMYILTFKKNNLQKIFFYLLTVFHCFIIIAVINVVRHYYFMHFYILIFSSAFLINMKGINRKIYHILVGVAYLCISILLFILL